jgi:Nif-specific regulatory protein
MKTGIEKLIEEGKFREDLYYRLNIVNIQVTNLKDRIDDIKILAEHFLNSGRNSTDTKILTGYAVKKLSEYNWPGNIQELKNIMERTFVLSDDRFIDEQHLPELTMSEQEEEQAVIEFKEMTLYELEKEHIIRTLDHLKGNKTRAAKSLGITVKTLYNKLHSYGIQIGRNE